MSKSLTDITTAYLYNVLAVDQNEDIEMDSGDDEERGRDRAEDEEDSQDEGDVSPGIFLIFFD